ncbi:hypothetical protein JIN85_04390 [Luteolibacter pohnpeiensis]|uniref:DUF3592 domain-containing protein n=1 Tax=Luteolibacter pohnpeiensis TaxID=454153 RepID=A0A934S499_9BACT|nr:DUF3592 domain-containing protein [Luteolibacter pohnpeiensis]MBK1881638.1 hypothetical protein [Luteolibacter pohnpeiensis]
MSDSDLKGDPELMEFLQSAPPRLVPAGFTKAIPDRKEVWGKVIFGAMFLILGSVFTLIFVPKNYIQQLSILRGPSTEVVGTVLDSTETSQSENEVKVWETTFQYRAEDGKEREGTVFRTGGGWDPNDRVRVIYLNRDPEKALIKGTRLDPFGPAASFVLIFPIAGLGLLLTAFKGRKRNKKLLRDGWVAQAMVADINKQSLRVNGRFRHTIQFVRLDDAQEMKWVTYDTAKIELCYRKREANEAVTLLYDPKEPKKIDLPEAWGKTFSISSHDYLEKTKSGTIAKPLQVAPWIDDFLNSPVPRKLPSKLRWNTPYLVRTSIPTIMGIGIFLTGAIFSSKLVSWNWVMKSRLDATAVATVVREEDGVDFISIPVIRVKYSFEDQYGYTHQSVVYTVGKGHPPGIQINVKYDRDHPEASLPDGFWIERANLIGIFLLIFPAIGLCMLVIPHAAESRRFRVLRHGTVEVAKIVRIEDTGKTENYQAVFAIWIQPINGMSEIRYETMKEKELKYAMRALDLGETIRVLIDPKHPKVCVLPETW